MKSTLISLVRLALFLCACLAAGCAADAGNDAIWYDDGERANAIWYDDGEGIHSAIWYDKDKDACFTNDSNGVPVEVTCPDDLPGGCDVDVCDPIH